MNQAVHMLGALPMPEPIARCACAKQHCLIKTWERFEPSRLSITRYWQHGDNPEALLIATDEDLFRDDWAQRWADWSNRVHQWLDATDA